MTATEITIPRNLRAAFAAAASSNPHGDFLYLPAEATRGWADGPLAISYRAAEEEVRRLAAAYQSAGYGDGHRVALLLDNRPEFFLHLLALNGIGASAVPISAAMTAIELRWILQHADVAAVISHAAHAPRVSVALPDGVSQFGLTDSPPAPGRGPAASADEAALLYTSGTTGKPKGCALGNRYFLLCGRHYVELGGLCQLRPGVERLITPLPVTHMNALCVSLTAMLLGANCLVQMDRFHPSSWWQSVRQSRATCFHYLGVMPALLLAAPPDANDNFQGQLRFGFGAGVDSRHHDAFEARFGVPLIEAWAMTETGAGAWITANHEPRHVGTHCFGRAPAGLEWRVVEDDGAEVTTGLPGELLVRREGPAVRDGFFSGYHKDDSATEAVWASGWFHTGDVVRVGADGSFYFVDRLKNIIRRSGENIAAVEVESVLQHHPGVSECAVTAVSDEIRSEEVFAFIVTTSNLVVDIALAKDIQKHCLVALSYYKAPGWVAFVDAIPRTASQKLARSKVKQDAAALIEQGAAHDLRPGKFGRERLLADPPLVTD